GLGDLFVESCQDIEFAPLLNNDSNDGHNTQHVNSKNSTLVIVHD
ncbi:35264_t:CDS:2, partial [Gigaspora margarita]